MKALFSTQTLIFILLILNSFFTPSFSKQSKSSHQSMVLGLTHSRNILPTPKPLKFSSKPESIDMMEALRGVRDGYIISLTLGTPPQVIPVYMDTGSDLTWVPCGNLSFDCMECDDHRNNKFMASFSTSYSSSSLRDSCSSPFCINIHSSDNAFDSCTVAGCSLSTLLKSTCSRPCPSFAYTYGEGVVVGSLTRDTLRVHGSNSTSSPSVVPRFCFGCVTSTYKEPIGIAGFGKGPLSLPSQLGFLQKGFSHCFLAFKYANNPNISSPLVVGDLAISSKDHLQFTPMLKSPMYPNYYYIGLEDITVGNTSVLNGQMPSILRAFDSQGNGGMLIDSGTTYTHLPEPLYSKLLSLLQSLISYPRVKDVEIRTGFDLCYAIPCPNNTLNFNMGGGGGGDYLLPTITFNFLNNVNLVLPQENSFYAMGAPSNSTVVKCLLFQVMESDGGGGGDEDQYYGPAGVFGSFQQQDVEVVYDLEKERIGFQTMDCASSAASQGLHNKRISLS